MDLYVWKLLYRSRCLALPSKFGRSRGDIPVPMGHCRPPPPLVSPSCWLSLPCQWTLSLPGWMQVERIAFQDGWRGALTSPTRKHHAARCDCLWVDGRAAWRSTGQETEPIVSSGSPHSFLGEVVCSPGLLLRCSAVCLPFLLLLLLRG